jgi:hypothetical protein
MWPRSWKDNTGTAGAIFQRLCMQFPTFSEIRNIQKLASRMFYAFFVLAASGPCMGQDIENICRTSHLACRRPGDDPKS